MEVEMCINWKTVKRVLKNQLLIALSSIFQSQESTFVNANKELLERQKNCVVDMCNYLKFKADEAMEHKLRLLLISNFITL